MAIASMSDDRTRFEEAHPPLMLEMTDEEGLAVQIPEVRLPRLLGWQVLLRPWSPPKQTKGGIFLPDQVADANEFMTYIFEVVRLGPLAFSHPRLRGGPKTGCRRSLEDNGHEEWWEHETTEFADGVIPPEVGDWVIVKKYAGIRLELEGVSFKLCNDDDILAVIDSPNGWRAYV